ncbi:hypothetical protein TRAPUB_5292 [Trametes pubescens]|uniref:Uncharacterized protein n=1 Tax=Trametes pubescens TaxID=154538 RepID=A0A1M2V925_TRAPU|nr:hypothetical protein TRAPUB_5292 [Trametes pubescens]
MLQPLNILTLLFIISWGCATVLGATQQIDNTSPQIQYQGAWSMTNSPGDGDFGDTLAFSQDNLDSATLHFSGTSVTVFGALKPVGTWNMHSAYYLDGAPVVGFTPNPVVASEQHRVTFYSSGSLSDGPHTLIIVNMGQQFYFDYIALESGSASATTAPIIHPGTPILPTSTTPTTSSSSLPTTSSASPPQTTSSLVRPSTSTSTSTRTSSSSTFTSSSTSVRTSFSSTSATSVTPPSPTGTSSNLTETSASASTPHLDTTDIIAISSQPSISTSSSTSTTPASTGTTTSGPILPLGEIIGIAVGGAALILTLALAFFALWRRHRRNAARIAISPFDPVDASDGTPLPPPPDYWPSEKSSAIDRARLTGSILPVQQPPARQMLVITHGDDAGGMWADYQSSMPTASGYHASVSSADGDLKALRADLARRAKRPAAVNVTPERRGVPF